MGRKVPVCAQDRFAWLRADDLQPEPPGQVSLNSEGSGGNSPDQISNLELTGEKDPGPLDMQMTDTHSMVAAHVAPLD